jgi:hypothetical protein
MGSKQGLPTYVGNKILLVWINLLKRWENDNGLVQSFLWYWKEGKTFDVETQDSFIKH